MDCNEARPLLDANADHELPAPDARRVQQHIETCADCRRESENLRALSGAVRGAPYHRAPASLRERIVAGLPAVEMAAVSGVSGAASGSDAVVEPMVEAAAKGAAKAPVQPKRWPAWLENLFGGAGGRGGGGHNGGSWGGGFGGPAGVGGVGQMFTPLSLAALVIALCALAAGVTMNLHRTTAGGGPFTDELVESHVRAQVSGRDIDVISTDRHTVKPWFNGKLDYTPPVEDLAASGFPLEGGRLDYLAHRRVAVLVYRYQKHVIDVYVFPQADAGANAQQATVTSPDGYSIAHWNAEGMTWWAITDAAPDALKGLESALKARLESGSERTEKGS